MKKCDIDPKDEISCTVSTESLMILDIIDSPEECGVDILDIPGAYLSVDMDDRALMLLC